MKKFYLFIFLLTCALLQSQTTTTTTASGTLTTSGSLNTNSTVKNHDRYYNSWRFGINLGATWETSDVRSTPGFAGGFTLEKGFCENKTNFLSWALKGRGLWGTAYGLDYTRNYDVKFNPALNGTYNKTINYDSTSDYVYNNYRTQIAEGALELQINFNSLRERTNILLNLWAGIGFTSYRVKTNLLDANNKMYNYYAVDSSGGKANIISSHKFLLDRSYESNARNSQNGNVLTLSPSCGVGLGYRFNDYVSILWEYKLTFPQGTYSDYLDGIKASNNDRIGCVKDYYHYTCINFLFKIGGGKHHTTNSSNVNNYTPAHTNTIVPSNSVTTIQPVIQKPIVNITNPPYTPYNETVITNFTVMAKVYNVNQRNELYVTFNGNEIKNYSWFGKTISFVAPLLVGNNVISVAATNPAGSDSKTAIINYNGIPPQITITTPGANQHITTQNIQDLYATVLNVESASNIFVKFNSANFSSFSFNPADHSLFMQLALVKGANSVEITATNAFGKDIKSQIIILNQEINPVTTVTSTPIKPVTVVITDPKISPYTSSQPNYNVKAKVTGVVTADEVTVTANSTPIAFSYLNGIVNFNVSLANGNTLVKVSASNGKSSDSKSTVLTYQEIIGTDVDLDKDITICHKNADGSNQTIVVKQSTWSQHQSHGDVMGVCPKVIEGNGTELDPKITICHLPPGNNNNPQTIEIPSSAWPAHQAHGDTKGACPKVIEGNGADLDPDITICHNNNGITQTINIKQSAWPAHQAHGDTKGVCPKVVEGNEAEMDLDVVICHKNADGTETKMTIKQSQWATHQAHGDYIGGNCAIQTTTATSTNTLEICHNNGDGTKSTITILSTQFATHRAHGDILGKCAAGSVGSNTTSSVTNITICHKNGDGSTTTMVIPSDQFNVHRAHGDVMGACAPPPEDKKITICHIPPGNNQNPQTIEINESAWPAHLAHGDSKGACPEQKTLKPDGETEIKEPKSEEPIKSPGRTKAVTEPQKTEEPKVEQPKTEEGKVMKPR